MKPEQDTAKIIIQMLDERVATLDDSIVNQLANARKQALLAHAQHASANTAQGHGVLRLFSHYIHSPRALMSTALVASAVFVAFILTQHLTGEDNAEQGDAFLLASELPPEAYLDKGFDTWLEQTSQR
jgi:hypothetical protein